MTPLKKKRRKEILDAALIVFGNDGFHKGTVENIAIEADIGKGTVYEYFNSKQEIFEQMILSILGTYTESAKLVIQDKNTTKEKLIALLNYDKQFINQHTHMIEKSMYALKDVSDEFKPYIIKLHKGIYNFVLDIVREGMENGEINSKYDENMIALLWLNVVSGFNKDNQLFNGMINIDHEQLIELLFEGIG